MANYSAKVNFEREIISCVNNLGLTNEGIIGLTENSILNWEKKSAKPNVQVIGKYLMFIAKQYGFIIEESNSLRSFNDSKNELEGIKRTLMDLSK